MLPPSSLVPPRTWRRTHKAKTKDEDDDFFVSTDQKYLSVKTINDAYAMDFLYWGKPFPEDVLKQILAGSLCFGVYKYSPRQQDVLESKEQDESRSQGESENESIDPESVEQVGFARVITDTVTFAYLTDVYVLPTYQSLGLGSWLVGCVAETLSASNMPYLRRVMLLSQGRESDGGQAEGFYGKKLGVKAVGREERPDLGKVFAVLGRRGGVPSTATEG